MPNTDISVLGCGSVGSCLADAMVRLGHHVPYLVDKDKVESKNKTKSIYTEVDVGRQKVDALREHLQRVNPAMEIRTICKFIEDLEDAEWDALLSKTGIILELADSRRGTEALIERVRQYDKYQGMQHIVIKMICLDNIAAGVTILWTSNSGLPCPCCLFQATPHVNTSDERSDRNDSEYSSDKLIGYNVRGVLPDLYFGLSLTSSLIHALIQELSEVETGRREIVSSFIKGSNIHLWSPFRDPFFDWQKDSQVSLMGGARTLTLAGSAACPYCGLGMEE